MVTMETKMQELLKARLGMFGFIMGLLGTGFAMGGVEAAQTVQEWITVIGTAVSSLMLMQLSVWLIKDAR